MKIISVIGARPNFIKIAPFIRSLEEFNLNNSKKFEHILVHTGQHYDIRMSRTFFDDLNIPEPDINLEVGSGTHAEQVGKTMIELEKVVHQINPDLIVVVGDVNAILAGAITAKKEHKLLAHIEAGLRSFDMTMPEEINRILADRISDLLFTPDKIANQNLINEGVPEKQIFFVGNIMIDTLLREKEKAEKLLPTDILKNNIVNNFGNKNTKLEHRQFILMTLHRPSNVDYKNVLEKIINFIIDEICCIHPVVFPIHPRTMNNIISFGLSNKIFNNPNFILLEPLRYHEMLRLNISAKAVITDSGGLQEECTVLGTPCFTMRLNTERPITLKEHGGMSWIVGNRLYEIKEKLTTFNQQTFNPVFPELWDGNTAKRIVDVIGKL